LNLLNLESVSKVDFISELVTPWWYKYQKPEDFLSQLNNIFTQKKASKMAFEFTDSNFQDTVLEKEGVVVVDFWAEWCGPCRMIGPIIEDLAKDYGDKVLVGKVDVDSNPEVSMQYGVRSIPTILILKDGEVVDKHVGVTTKEALAGKINKFL
jgi:thioredoxin 1